MKCPHCNLLMLKPYMPAHLTTENCSVCKIKYLCKGIKNEHKECFRLKCEICLKELNSAASLRLHITKHHKDKDVQGLAWIEDLGLNLPKYMCGKCKRCFFNAMGLRNHLASTHRKNKPLLTCHFCKKNFKFLGYIKRHIISKHTNTDSTRLCK